MSKRFKRMVMEVVCPSKGRADAIPIEDVTDPFAFVRRLYEIILERHDTRTDPMSPPEQLVVSVFTYCSRVTSDGILGLIQDPCCSDLDQLVRDLDAIGACNASSAMRSVRSLLPANVPQNDVDARSRFFLDHEDAMAQVDRLTREFYGSGENPMLLLRKYLLAHSDMLSQLAGKTRGL